MQESLTYTDNPLRFLSIPEVIRQSCCGPSKWVHTTIMKLTWLLQATPAVDRNTVISTNFRVPTEYLTQAMTPRMRTAYDWQRHGP